MEKIIILDFNTGDVYVYPFPENLSEASDFFETDTAIDENLNEEDCQFMVTSNEIKLNI